MRASQQDDAEDEKDNANVDKGALAGNADAQKGRADCDERDATFRHEVASVEESLNVMSPGYCPLSRLRYF